MPGDVLVINLTRFGDLLQSQATIDDLHKSGWRVNLLCLDNFASAARLLRNVDKVWPLPGGRLLAQINSDWSKALTALREFTGQILAQGHPDAILNLTPALPARLLTRLLSGPDTRQAGFSLDEYGYGLNHGVWASFFAVAAEKRANAPFNLADMMRMLAASLTGGQQGEYRLNRPADSDLSWACAFLSGKAVEFAAKPHGYVAFQLGASQQERRWPIARFRELGAILWQKLKLAPLLLGTQAEAGLGERFMAEYRYPAVNAIGKTDLGKLGALLVHSRLLVSNDTGTMHLAAGLDCPVLAIFLATAQPVDTGPLAPGSCSLEPELACHPCAFGASCPNDHECRQKISAATVASYALAFLEHGDFSQGPTAANVAEAAAWLTTRNGLTGLLPLSPNALTGSRLWLAWLRRFWQGLLAALDAPIGSTCGSCADYEGLPLPEDAARLASAASRIEGLFAIAATCGREALKSAQMAKIFLRNCERAQTALDGEPQLATLTAFWRELRFNQGDDIARLALQTEIMAAHLHCLALALRGHENCKNLAGV